MNVRRGRPTVTNNVFPATVLYMYIKYAITYEYKLVAVGNKKTDNFSKYLWKLKLNSRIKYTLEVENIYEFHNCATTKIISTTLSTVRLVFESIFSNKFLHQFA